MNYWDTGAVPVEGRNKVGKRRWVWALMAVVVLLSVALLPMAASARRADFEQGSMYIPRYARQAYTLAVGDVSVTIPAGAMPGGGRIKLQVWTYSDGHIEAQFLPDREFARPVLMNMGSCAVVYWVDGRWSVPIRTADLDGDGDLGEWWSTHFSRYSGWF